MPIYPEAILWGLDGIEQDHRFIKSLTKQMKGFKPFDSASAKLERIEVAHMIRKQ